MKTRDKEKRRRGSGKYRRERGREMRGEERGKLKTGEGGLRLADVTDISIRLWGEESAEKREVYHLSFVLPKQEENRFVQAAAWWGDKWFFSIFLP